MRWFPFLVLLLLALNGPPHARAAFIPPAATAGLCSSDMSGSPRTTLQMVEMYRQASRFFQPQKPTPGAPSRKKGAWCGIVSCVLGVVSVVAVFTAPPLAAILLSLGAWGFGLVGLNHRRLQGFAIAGLLLGIVGLALAFRSKGRPFY